MERRKAVKNKDKNRDIMQGAIMKAAQVASLEADDQELELINKLTLVPLAPEDVFVFKVAMCDNEVDRSFEAFTKAALEGLKSMYVGRTMIKDHARNSDNQVARIYATELIENSGVTTKTGETYCQLVAHCYMLNTEANKDMINEIKGGIKKEVSVSVRIGKAVCSICGMDNFKSSCSHWWGVSYEGQVCHFSLEEPLDAFELSFVAVPAQPNAGTMKSYGIDKEEGQEAEVEKTDELEEFKEKQLADLRIKAVDAYIYSLNIQKTEGEQN